MPYPGWVRRGREPSTPRRALSCLNDIATMNASYLALSCLEHVLLLCTTTKTDREFSSAVRAHTISRVLSSSPRFVNNKGGVMAVRACALISCALLQAWTSSLLTWHSLTNHVSLSLLELAAVHAASRLSGLQLHLVQAAWQAVLLHSSQHSELLGIDSLIMKCGICGSQIMVLILARDTTHWAVRVLSSSSVPAHLPIIHKLA